MRTRGLVKGHFSHLLIDFFFNLKTKKSWIIKCPQKNSQQDGLIKSEPIFYFPNFLFIINRNSAQIYKEYIKQGVFGFSEKKMRKF
jgi:hypothetical protein